MLHPLDKECEVCFWRYRHGIPAFLGFSIHGLCEGNSTVVISHVARGTMWSDKETFAPSWNLWLTCGLHGALRLLNLPSSLSLIACCHLFHLEVVGVS